ncbi:MAG: 60S ribosomal export protein NMD3 [Candidatus Thorarchaeota archaeon]
MKAPCYLCGEPSVLDGLCQNCYNSEHPLIGVNTPLSITTCKKCGSMQVPGGWKTLSSVGSDDQREEQIGILLDMEIKSLGHEISVEIEEANRLDRVLHVRLHITGKSSPDLDAHTEEYPVEIRYNHATCDMCSMMSGGYYEATLQIRANERPVTEEEQERVVEIARDRTIAEYGKDKGAFILQIDDTKFGLDLFFGSDLLCRKVADEVEALLLADRKENFKLVTQERGGKRKYRITIVLRLPQYVVGDFIEVVGNPCQVLGIGKGGLACYDLVERQRFTINQKSSKWRTIIFIAKGTEKRAFSIISNVYGQPLQIMDSKTYEIREIEDDSIREGLSGDTLYLIEHNQRWYLVPELKESDIKQ